MSAPKLLFLATEDWFVRSHFLPLVRRAHAEGYEPVVAARDSGALAGEGVRVIDTPFARGSLNPWLLQRQVSELRALLARERPAIVHAIALRPVLLMALSGADVSYALALTGRGYLAVSDALGVKAISACFRGLVRMALDKPGRVLLVENTADRAWIEGGRALPDDRVVLMPGAGVEADLVQTPQFTPPPIVVGVASRLVRSKGIDLAVAALQRLRAEGLDIELRIAGAVDPDNPERVSEADLLAWRAAPGVSLLGRVTDIDAFWAGCHIACLPSRGGEGLPRMLLEAAARGRAIVTTDVPGCSDFVSHGETGLIAPPENAEALAAALKQLAQSGDQRQRLADAGLSRVRSGYTVQHSADAAAEAWRAIAHASASS